LLFYTVIGGLTIVANKATEKSLLVVKQGRFSNNEIKIVNRSVFSINLLSVGSLYLVTDSAIKISLIVFDVLSYLQIILFFDSGNVINFRFN
jgi:hypothetical protein